MIAHVLAGHDPALNLALEEVFFRKRQAGGEDVLLLWQNAPSVIIGRHQNAQAQVCAEWLDRQQIPLLRRLTGGGAVYHDLGNLNYTFLTASRPGAPIDFLPCLRHIASALEKLGVPVTMNSRNDLAVEGRKVSGSAQLRGGGAMLHHGTLLYEVDLDAMSCALTPDPEKLSRRGVASVRARVMNLKERLPAGVGVAALGQAIIATCRAREEAVPAALFEKAQKLAEARYRTWAWNVGASPAHDVTGTRRFAWGGVSYGATIRQGRLAAITFQGDFFGQELEELERRLTGVSWQKEALGRALAGAELEKYFHGCDRATLIAFLLEQAP